MALDTASTDPQMSNVATFSLFVQVARLRFDLATLLEQCVTEWADGRLLPDGYEDAVVAEMDRRGLRWLSDDADEALFHRGKSRDEYGQCVLAGLQRLADDACRPRTADDVAHYYRPCAE
jgi:hypothetical protein